MLDKIIVLSGFILLLMGYYKFAHKKMVNSLDIQAKKISDDIATSESKLDEYSLKLEEMEKEFVNMQINFKQTCDQITDDLNKIREEKLQSLEVEMTKNSSEVESRVETDYLTQQAKIKDRIIETAYLLAIEYFRNKSNYSETSKRKIIQKLFKNVKIN